MSRYSSDNYGICLEDMLLVAENIKPESWHWHEEPRYPYNSSDLRFYYEGNFKGFTISWECSRSIIAFYKGSIQGYYSHPLSNNPLAGKAQELYGIAQRNSDINAQKDRKSAEKIVKNLRGRRK